MNPCFRLPRLSLTLALLALVPVCPPARGAEPEVHVRDGLPNLGAPGARGELRVAYLGGSITAADDGWRTLTTDYLRAHYPQRRVMEIAAGVPGTGSNLGACRLGRDVLRHHPDLVFVEFAVNDANAPAELIERTMEGIVRQTWRANPRTDLCFVYTVSAPGLPYLEAGAYPPAARAMERVAAHYGIPSLHFGVEVARRVARGALTFRNPAAPRDPHTFSVDGVHPTPAGHRIYFHVLERALPALLAAGPAGPHPLPPPLHADNWEDATLRRFADLKRHGDWSQVAPDDANLRGATKALLPPTWRAATPGASVEFEFRGRSFGLVGVAAPDNGEFRVTVDDRPPVSGTFFDAFVSPTFCREREWFFPGELADGPHHVRVELTGTHLDKAGIKATRGHALEDPRAYAPHRLTLCGALIVGSPKP
ncbi:MAG TPA: GDSL-type esterase/lipase family protein [Opitutaceae bacterium]|nr:GDSL-type esterase/lipase family protein [Opitutaceae bacterium]